MIYLDNAATSGIKPSGVINAVGNALRQNSANPGRSGYKTSMETAYRIFSVRTKVKDFFGADSEENVVFTLNCTHALNCVIKGSTTDGGHIVTSDIEHNAVMRPLKKVADNRNVKISVVTTHHGDFERTAEGFKNAITPDTRLVVCTHASNVTGAVNPIAQIGEICKERGVPFAVDAAQSGAVLPIDMQKMNIDYLCIASHKGLYAPMGTGILVARRPLKNTIIEGGTGTSSLDFVQPNEMPERFESGTVNVPGIFGIGAGIDFVKARGIKSIYRHEMDLIRYLYKKLQSNKKIILYTPFPENDFAVPVLSFNILGHSSVEAADLLARKNIAVRAGLHCAPTAHKKLNTEREGTVRVSTGLFNTKKDIDYLVNVLKFL